MKTLEDSTGLKDILERLESITPNSQRVWGSMTAQEMLCHLADSCECAFGRGAVTFSKKTFKQATLKFIALRMPVKWPQGIKTRPAFDPRQQGTKPTGFEADKQRAISMVRKLAEVNDTSLQMYHPIFGSMSTADWKRWGYLHADHHLRQFSA
jgi:hypothetical protein